MKKFRIWHKDRNRFYYPNDDISLEFYADAFFVRGPDHEGPGAVIGSDKNCVVQEFTQLKDQNDKEIFEGDIIKHVDYDIKETVFFQDGAFCASSTSPLFEINTANFEILGNIFETPELLNQNV